MFIPGLPTNTRLDPVRHALFTKNDLAIRKIFSQLTRQLDSSSSLYQNIIQCFSFYEAFDSQTQQDLASHPLFRNWWLQLKRLLRQGETEPVKRWLAKATPFFIIPAIEQGKWLEGTLHVPVTAEGEIRFPGHPRHIELGKDHRGVLVAFERKADVIEIRCYDNITTVNISDLCEAPSPDTSSSVRQRPVLAGTRIEIDASHPWLQHFLDTINAEDAIDPYPKRDLQPVIPIPDELVKLHKEAIELVGSAWPEMLAEIKDNIRLIVPFHTERLLGFSHIHFSGAIFLSYKPGELLHTAERMVHEASHVRLNSIQMVDKLHHHAPDELFKSPFRADPRPVNGIYHGSFVFGRLSIFMLRAFAYTGDIICRQRAQRMTSQFEESLDILFNQVKLTRIGRQILEDIVNELNHLNVIAL